MPVHSHQATGSADGAPADPSWDPVVRHRVHRAVDAVLSAARDVVTRYCDDDGSYTEPPEVADGGDVSGVINAAEHQVIRRLQEELDRARAAIRQVRDEIHDHRRQAIGPGYQPRPAPDDGAAAQARARPG